MKEILFNTCVFADNKVWFMSNARHFMYMDIRTNKISFVMVNKINEIKFREIADNMLFDGTDIYWVEYGDRHLVKYSIQENRCEFYQIPPIERQGEENIAALVLYNKKIYIFPRYTPCLLVFDTVDKTFSMRDELYRAIQNRTLKKKERSLWRSVSVNDVIFLFGKYENTVIKYYLDRDDFEILPLYMGIETPICMLWKEDIFYILCSDSSIYSWDGYSHETKKIYSSTDGVTSFGRISATKNKLFLMPSRADKVRVIDLKSLESEDINNYPNDFKYNELQWSRYHGSCENEGYIWWANRSANYILRLDKKKDLAEWIKIKPPSLKEECDYYVKSDKRVFREQETDIRILFEDIGKKYDSTAKTTIGSDIWSKLGGNINDK